jgi:hypothetical protein
MTNQSTRVLFAEAGKQLRTCTLLLCPQLGGEAVLAIAKHCPLLEHVLLPEATVPAVVRCVHLKRRPTGSGWPQEKWVQGLVMLAAAAVFFCVANIWCLHKQRQHGDSDL